MITPLERIQKNQTGAGIQRGRQYCATVRLTKECRDIMYENTRKEMEKIERAAGVEMHKTARVIIRRGRFRQQAEGLKIINQTLQEITKTENRDDVHAHTGIATGYANAMRDLGLMSESELDDVIAVIGQAGERALHRIETTKPLFSIH
ncbi:MAG: hypothetical protein K2N41_04495 [Lachnospiraceae bacterium]|nr:hypothetical protein [Lachnospiraceae bacterium]MDE7238953.1 hypothetical protein [Lachnospiraceae bacterium]